MSHASVWKLDMWHTCRHRQRQRQRQRRRQRQRLVAWCFFYLDLCVCVYLHAHTETQRGRAREREIWYIHARASLWYGSVYFFHSNMWVPYECLAHTYRVVWCMCVRGSETETPDCMPKDRYDLKFQRKGTFTRVRTKTHTHTHTHTHHPDYTAKDRCNFES